MNRLDTLTLIFFFLKHTADKNIWKVYAPDKLIQLPSCCFSDQLPDVRCITEVGDRVWIAAGMSMYIFEAEEMCREVVLDG